MQKIFRRGLVYAALRGHKNANPLLNGGQTGKCLRQNSAMLRGLASNVDFFEKMVIFHEFFDEAHGNAQNAFETVD